MENVCFIVGNCVPFVVRMCLDWYCRFDSSSQKGFKETENVEHIVVFLQFLYILYSFTREKRIEMYIYL